MNDAQTTPPPGSSDPLALVATLRPDLRFARLLFGGEPSYVVRDPLTGEAHRLPPDAYRTLCALDGRSTLGITFQRLVERGVLAAEQRDEFVRFVHEMQVAGIVSLPVDDAAERSRRKRERAARQARARGPLSFLFARIPLGSPDRMLTALLPYARPLFSRTAVILWTLMVVAAGWALAVRFDDFGAPLLDAVSLERLPLIALLLVVLKAIHEFGHALACRRFGGHVPEMGVMMFVLAPLAYVDANAAWSFPERRHRIAVSLAGMYFEIAMAAIAVLVWVATPPGLANTLAYQTVLLASVTTVLFNLNPLMRFDGYHLLTDLVGVPNLRQRGKEEFGAIADRLLFGVPRPASRFGSGGRAALAGFGAACSIYRVTLVLSICATIATELFFVGLALAGVYVVHAVGTALVGWIRHLWKLGTDAGSRGVGGRLRVAGVALLTLVAAPIGLGLVRWPAHVAATGIVTADDERVVRATVPGRFESADVPVGETVAAGRTVCVLANAALVDGLELARAEHSVAALEVEAAAMVDPVAADRLRAREAVLAARAARAAGDAAGLEARAPVDGVVVRRAGGDDVGRFFAVGDELFTLAAGPRRVRLLAAETELFDGVPSVGTRLRCRPAAAPDETFDAEIVAVNEAGSRSVRDRALTHLGGGDVVVSADSRQAAGAYFEITVAAVDDRGRDLLERLPIGTRVGASIDAGRRTLLDAAIARVMRFAHAVRVM